jgi:hypothetical protein
MALPKKLKKNIDINRVDPQGGPREWWDQFLDQNKQFLPRSVDFTDLDAGFVDFVETDLGINIKGEKVPIHFLTLQRWNEFSRLWPNTDKYKNLTIPFVSVVRRPNPETGTNPADFKIPIRKNFPYMQIPVWDGNRNGADIYGIPNPVGVDMIYTVRFFSYRMRELNKLHQKVLQTFASAQAYVNIKGHYFPILLESIGDESQIDDLEGKRFYIQTYEMKLQGYLVDQEEFEIKPAISRAFITTEIERKRLKPITRFIKDDTKDEKSIKVIIQFLVGSPTNVSFVNDNNTNFVSIDLVNITDYTIRKNGVITNLPFTVNMGDTLSLDIVKTNSTQISEIKINGILLSQ